MGTPPPSSENALSPCRHYGSTTTQIREPYHLSSQERKEMGDPVSLLGLVNMRVINCVIVKTDPLDLAPSWSHVEEKERFWTPHMLA